MNETLEAALLLGVGVEVGFGEILLDVAALLAGIYLLATLLACYRIPSILGAIP